MTNGNVSRISESECQRELWHFKLSDNLTLHFHKYELIRCNPFNRDTETVSLWQYPDLTNKSTIPQPDIPSWAIQDAKALILSKIKIP